MKFCSYLSKIIIPWIVLLLLVPSCNTVEDGEHDRPNIILLITDDQGYGDLGLHGNPLIHTPVIDSLGRLSKRFTHFYVSPVCAPTRASLMTGRYSLRTGVYDTYNGGAIMSDREITMAEYLKKAGYRTGIFGKWHLGDAYPFRPQDQGFDEVCVHAAGGIGQPGDLYENFIKGDSSYFNPVITKNGTEIRTDGYCSDVFTEFALEFIRKEKENPFFAYISYNAPHTPLQVPDSYLSLYDSLRFASLLSDHGGAYAGEMSGNDIEAARRVYAMVTNIDDNIRRLWKAVQTEGIADRTLIIFMTDNGPQQRRYTCRLRGRKGSVYEGGIRVPSFWYWPGHIMPGEDSRTATHMDVLPTLIDVCGIPADSRYPFDGISLLPLLMDKNSSFPERDLVHYWFRGYPEPYHNIAYRSGNMKLVGQGDYRMEKDDFELYDIVKDPYEQHDLSAEAPHIVDSLRRRFDSWYVDIMESSNLTTQRIHIGSGFQNPVLLNRNDMKGPSAKQWMSETGMGYWDVFVAESGLYNVKVRFFNTVEVPGSTTVRFGKVQRTIETNGKSGDLIVFEDVPLKRGEVMAEAWHQYNWKITAPLYVEVLYVGE